MVRCFFFIIQTVPTISDSTSRSVTDLMHAALNPVIVYMRIVEGTIWAGAGCPYKTAANQGPSVTLLLCILPTVLQRCAHVETRIDNRSRTQVFWWLFAIYLGSVSFCRITTMWWWRHVDALVDCPEGFTLANGCLLFRNRVLYVHLLHGHSMGPLR
jgi:hypothetical protein